MISIAFILNFSKITEKPVLFTLIITPKNGKKPVFKAKSHQNELIMLIYCASCRNTGRTVTEL